METKQQEVVGKVHYEAADSQSQHTIGVESINGKGLEEMPAETSSSSRCSNSPEMVKPTVEIAGFKKMVVFLSLALIMLVASLDLTIVTTAIPKISQQFDALSDATWISTAYMLTTTALQPLYGRLSDTFGRVPTLIFSIVIFFGGSASCGWAQSMGVLIFGRALQGVGGAGLVALVFIIISDVTTEAERPAFMGVLGAVWSIASVIGPVLGGVFSDKVSWRWAFLINLPISGVVFIIVVGFLRLPQPHGSLREKLKRVDLLGSLVLIGGVVMLLLALTWGGKTFPWKSARIICLLVFSFLSLGLFLLIEWKTPADPTVPIPLLRNRNVSLAVAGQFFAGVAMFVPMFYIPIWYTIVKNDSAISSGLHLLPYLLSVSLVSVASGFIVTKTGRYRRFVIVGSAIMVVGTGLMVMFNEDIGKGKQIGYLILMGFGLGLNIQIMMIVTQTAASTEDMAAATTLFLFMRILGASIGIAAMESIFQNYAIPHITDLASANPQYASVLGASFNDQSLIYKGGLPLELQHALVHVYVEGLKRIFIANVPFAAIAFLLTLPLKHIPLC
ncbi:hypothetical protein GGI23_002013 [Coemansia sp. RSA 2559]|nr:hypothetical protein GGI23_002013 [Coemansia sp. RSA 2559]KAJ2866165.1 hypothetical protein GGI22_001339 [Coemansia erecta]